MATVTKKSTLPYYCAAAVWVLYALLFPLYTVGQLLTAGIGSALMFFVMNALCPPIEVEVEEKPVEEKPTGNEALDKMLKEGNMALAEMQRLDDSIQDEKISADIQTLKEICGKIFQQVKNDPAKLPEIRRFMNYYLPTTLKLLNSYDRMGVEHIYQTECQRRRNHNQNEVCNTVCLDIRREVETVGKYLTYRLRTEILERVNRVGHRNTCKYSLAGFVAERRAKTKHCIVQNCRT